MLRYCHLLPCHLVEYSEDENPGHCLLRLAHGAPDSGGVGVADVDVALHGQCQGQPLEINIDRVDGKHFTSTANFFTSETFINDT